MPLQVLYEHEGVRRPAFGLRVLYQPTLATLLQTGSKNIWTDSVGSVPIAGNNVFVGIGRPGTAPLLRALELSAPTILTVDDVDWKLGVLRREFQTSKPRPIAEYGRLCRKYVEQFLPNDAVSDILWAKSQDGRFGWDGFCENPASCYASIVMAAATTIRFERFASDIPSDEAKWAATCIEATLRRLAAIEKYGGQSGYMLRWTQKGVGTLPHAKDWQQDPAQQFISGCDEDYAPFNVWAEPSQDEYTYYASGLGLAIKVLWTLDFSSSAWTRFSALTINIVRQFARCMSYLSDSNYFLLRPCRAGSTGTSRGASAHTLAHSFESVRHHAISAHKRSMLQIVAPQGSVSPGALFNSFGRWFEHATRAPKFAGFDVAGQMFSAYSAALGFSTFPMLLSSRLVPWAIALALDQSEKSPAFNRAMYKRMMLCSYEDDSTVRAYIFYYRDLPPIVGDEPRETYKFSPLAIALKVWFGVLGGEDWIDAINARLSGFLSDSKWLAFSDGGASGASGMLEGLLNSRFQRSFLPFDLAREANSGAQGSAFDRLDTLIAYSMMCLALDLPPGFKWESAASKASAHI